MSVKITVERDGGVVFSLATGVGRESASNTMCSKQDLPSVMDAIENALSFCKIESSRFDDTDRVSHGGSSASEVNRDVPVSVMRDDE